MQVSVAMRVAAIPMPLTTVMIHPRVSLSRTMSTVFVSYAKSFLDTGTNIDALQMMLLKCRKEIQKLEV